MTDEIDDLVEFFDYVSGRLEARLTGLGESEWRWCPTDDARLTLRWRLQHITDMLVEARNWAWLGVTAWPNNHDHEPSESAENALVDLGLAVAAMRELLRDESLDVGAPIGSAAGQFGSASRRSFIHHVLDELIHHGAEAALLRDLYARRQLKDADSGGTWSP